MEEGNHDNVALGDTPHKDLDRTSVPTSSSRSSLTVERKTRTPRPRRRPSTSGRLSAAYGIYHLAVITALMLLLILELPRMPGWTRVSHRARLHVHHSDSDDEPTR